MIALIQRVIHADVRVEGRLIAEIEHGLLVLVGIEKTDTSIQADKLAQKLLNYRVFNDKDGKMNLNIMECGGEILLVSQFTLAANTRKGNRPGFDPAMPPQQAEPFFAQFCDDMQARYPRIARGQFGADMQVALINDGPVTFWLQT